MCWSLLETVVSSLHNTKELGIGMWFHKKGEEGGRRPLFLRKVGSWLEETVFIHWQGFVAGIPSHLHPQIP